MSEVRSEWTAMAEGIAFISATLGEPYTSGQGNGLYWSALAVPRRDGTVGYPVALENLGSEIKVIISFMDANDGSHTTTIKLMAIIGWATIHGYECEHD